MDLQILQFCCLYSTKLTKVGILLSILNKIDKSGDFIVYTQQN